MRAIPMGGCFNHPRKSRSESPAKKSLFGLCKLRRMSEFFFKSQGQARTGRGLGVCLSSGADRDTVTERLQYESFPGLPNTAETRTVRAYVTFREHTRQTATRDSRDCLHYRLLSRDSILRSEKSYEYVTCEQPVHHAVHSVQRSRHSASSQLRSRPRAPQAAHGKPTCMPCFGAASRRSLVSEPSAMRLPRKPASCRGI